MNLKQLHTKGLLKEPVVFQKFQPALNWSFSSSTPDSLADKLGSNTVKFRLGRKNAGT